ncbi:MAG: hypothetical protein LBN22_00250 [Clostridiales Family XIII bacterium]|jgi:predicted membrane protein|nr:hypothetical protein [Clostridiales Family XIII bacterium]
MTKKTLNIISAIIFISLMALITVPPITDALQRVHPYIGIFPFFQFFMLIVPVLLAIWLIIWFNLECKIEDRDDAKADADAEKKRGGDAK